MGRTADMNAHQLPKLSLPHTYDPELRKLTIRNAPIFPPELFAHADDIEILDMTGGQLQELPHDLGRLNRLRVAFFSDNPLGHVPKALAGCATLEMVGLKSCQISNFDDNALPGSLRGLILTDNNLTKLPPAIGKLSLLQKLMLAGNNITALPAEMSQCRNLQILRLPANKLAAVPAWLWELPKLAWYSDAGNPISYNPQFKVPGLIPWQQLQLQAKLGESAKNIVYRAILKTSGQEVAVKLYGNGVTTDGHPQDEMYASIIAKNHANLIPIIGQITGAPKNQRGLVMELIPPSFSVPGLPPDLTTLTRDVIPKQLDLLMIAKILRDVCSALQHLHRQGIMHGDIYAHNLLTSPTGHTYLGDLGAATPYETSTDYGRRERIDVRGFGYLVADILPKVTPTDRAKFEKLCNLRDRCLKAGVKAITRFDTVQIALKDL